VSELDPRIQKAFDFAQESTKQLITLSTAVITLTITFLTDVVKEAPAGSAAWLQAAWIFYLVSIVFGVFALLALTGSLGSRKEAASPSIYSKNIVVPSMAQVVCFFTAVALTLVFGFKAV
jgi:hypothetical protein